MAENTIELPGPIPNIENPKGVAGLWLSFFIALTAILTLVLDLDGELVALINIALAALVAAVSETVRRL